MSCAIPVSGHFSDIKGDWLRADMLAEVLGRHNNGADGDMRRVFGDPARSSANAMAAILSIELGQYYCTVHSLAMRAAHG